MLGKKVSQVTEPVPSLMYIRHNVPAMLRRVDFPAGDGDNGPGSKSEKICPTHLNLLPASLYVQYEWVF